MRSNRPYTFFKCLPDEVDVSFAVHDDADDNYSEMIRAGWKLQHPTRLAMQLLGDEDVFIDLGANIGTFSAPVTLSTGAGCLDVEAVPSNIELLLATLERNKIANHTVEGVAAMDERGSVHVRGTSAFGTVSLEDDGIEVPALPLDDLLLGTPYEHARLIKMDIEGSELRASPGCQSSSTGISRTM